MKITIRQMEIFLEVAKIGHLTKVAQDLGMSQSAISMSIKEMESLLGCKLFERIQKKLVLNEKGRLFAHEIEPLIQKLGDIENEFKTHENSGELVVGASTTIADYILSKIACEYMDNYPRVKIRLRIGNTQDIIDMVERGIVDLGFIEGTVGSVNIISEIVGLDELVIVTGDKNLGAKKEYFIDTVLEKKWILREAGSGTRDIFLQKIKKFAPNLHIFMELSRTEAIKSVLGGQDCLGCISKISVKREIEEGRLFEIKLKGFDFKREFLMIHHREKYKSDLLKKFTIFARHKFKEILT